MSPKLNSLAVTLAAGLVLAAAAAAADLISLYGFDTSATADVDGTLKRGAYAGITLNGSVGSGTPTVSGGALVLDGRSTLNLNLSSTIAANPLDATHNASIAIKFKTSASLGGLLASGQLWLTVHDKNGQGVQFGIETYGNRIFAAGTNLADGNWHTAVFTYDASKRNGPDDVHAQLLYVDGTTAVADPNGDWGGWSSNKGAAAVTLGISSGDYNDTQVKFNGQIDYVAFFSDTLTSGEVTNINAGDFSAYVKGGASASLHHFEVTATSQQMIGSPFSVTVTAMDVDGMPLTNDSSTLVTMTSNTGHAQFDSDANGTFGDNIKTLSSGSFTITTKDAVAESVTFTATGGDKTGSSLPITVSAPPPQEIVSFGTGTHRFSLTFGQVTAAYNMGATEVLNDAFNKFYLATKGVAYAANAGLALTDTACNVSGLEVVDFINWLNTSSGLPAAYTFNGAHTALVNWNRTPGAKFFLPTVAEWNGALVYLNYAPGLCTDEWIQDTSGGGENLDGVMDGTANKSWDDSFTGSYDNVGFRVISDPNVSIANQSPFNAWVAGAPLTGFTADPNQDGVANGLAWLLHGTAMGNSRTCLPLATTAAGKLVLSFQCLKASAR
ncbi:MAG: LamG-like jellyroll fold domain-containing protein, partial [Verrucomicrobiota bacterium]